MRTWKSVTDRIIDTAAIEQRLLDLAYTTDAKITATALAYFAPCSIDVASRVLDDLAAHDRLTMEIEDDGTIVYQLPGRQKLTTPRAPAALVPVAAMHRGADPLVAAMLSVLLPGAGHFYAGRIVAGILWFLVVGIGYALILPGLVLHLFSIASAAVAAQRLNTTRMRMLPPGPLQWGAD
jgi:TM2 domain-containing membrane protein YozV